MNFKKIFIVLLFACMCFFSACGVDSDVTVLELNGDITISADGSITCDGKLISGSKNTNLKSSAEYVIKQDGSIIVRVDGNEYLIQKDVDVVIPAKDADIPQITTSSNNIYSIPLDGINVGNTTITHDCSIVSGDNKITSDENGNMVISTSKGDYIINKKDVKPLSSNDDTVSVTLPDGQTVGVTDIMDIINGISINLDGSITIDGSIVSNSDEGITLSTEFGDYSANVNNVTISAEEVKNLVYQITGEDGNVLDLINLAKDITIDKNGNVVTPNGTISIQDGMVTIDAPKKSTAYILPNGIVVDRGAIERNKDGTVILPETVTTFTTEDDQVVVVYENEMKFTPDNLCYEYTYWTFTTLDGFGNYSSNRVAKTNNKAAFVTVTLYDYNYLDEWNEPRMIYVETTWISDSELVEHSDYEYDADGFNTQITSQICNPVTRERSKTVTVFTKDDPFYCAIYSYDKNDKLINHTEIHNFDDPDISFPQVYKRFNSNGVLVHYSEMDKTGTEIVVCEYADDGTLLRHTTPNSSTYYNEDGTHTMEYWYADGSGGYITTYATGDSLENIRDTQDRYIYQKYYDSNGELINYFHYQYDIDGYAKITTIIRNNYDQSTPYKTMIYENADEITLLRQEYTIDEKLISELKYADDGTPIYIEYFDSSTNTHTSTYYNVDGWWYVETCNYYSTGEKRISYAKKLENKGYEGIEQDFVEKAIKVIYYYSNGNVYSISEYDEDFENNFPILFERYNQDGALIYKESLNHSLEHMEDGTIVEMFKNDDGSIRRITIYPNGSKYETVTNAQGEQTYEANYDTNGDLLFSSSTEYNVDGYAKKVTSILEYNTDSNIYKTIKCYNHQVILVSDMSYNKNGVLVEDTQYDDDGNCLYIKTYHDTGSPKNALEFDYNVDGWYYVTKGYSYPSGKIISYSYHDHNLLCRKYVAYLDDGTLWWISEYDENGNEIYTKYYI
ncbi:MAG: hypothetical protein E7312_00555 [Clostridiales bacterium]|nr:hypothetical protein [Clostridiales bacterium]